jgi:hypothetical protein
MPDCDSESGDSFLLLCDEEPGGDVTEFNCESNENINLNLKDSKLQVFGVDSDPSKCRSANRGRQQGRNMKIDFLMHEDIGMEQ